MKKPFRTIEELQQELGHIAVQVSRVRFEATATVSRAWAPPVNAFRCGTQYLVCVELAGVNQSAIDIRASGRRLEVRGVRPVPEPSSGDSPALRMLALEIEHGRFQRTIELPEEIEPDRISAEYRDGFLWVRLPLRHHG